MDKLASQMTHQTDLSPLNACITIVYCAIVENHCNSLHDAVLTFINIVITTLISG